MNHEDADISPMSRYDDEAVLAIRADDFTSEAYDTNDGFLWIHVESSDMWCGIEVGYPHIWIVPGDEFRRIYFNEFMPT